jgi:hypothetical protein
MKIPFTLLALTFACGAAFAQAPAGVVPRPSQEQNPNASGGAAQTKGEMKNDVKTGKAVPGAPMAAMNNTAMGNKAMDTNGDGMISRKEWDAYHGNMWRGMKADKRGMVQWSDVESRMKQPGGPN